ncbi:SRPBCC domain-containing protein [Sphingomonas sp. 7/4-4]|nr:SRPBCC domain-containing protein [Sphingomonas sp. 7/4-4]WBY08527.1 SRPBCC domain-containing protein [Sphingomonas sp. 7/4-4]
MPATAQATAPLDFEIDRDAHTLRFVREFAAPREIVFQAWTTPEELSCWWDAGGTRLTECEMDLRPGGSFRFVSPATRTCPSPAPIWRSPRRSGWYSRRWTPPVGSSSPKAIAARG